MSHSHWFVCVVCQSSTANCCFLPPPFWTLRLFCLVDNSVTVCEMKMPAMSSTESLINDDAGVDGVVGVDWLWAQLRGVDAAVAAASATAAVPTSSPITLLDCRSAADFGQCHIRRAVHLSLPSIMLRRLAGGKVTIGSVLKSSSSSSSSLTTGNSGGTAQQQHNNHTFVLCGGAGEIMSVLRKSLMQDGCPVVCLQGKYLSINFVCVCLCLVCLPSPGSQLFCVCPYLFVDVFVFDCANV